MNKRKTLTVKDKRFHGFNPSKNGKELVFKVVTMKNTTDYIVGEKISNDEIRILNDRPNWEVVVKGR